jgi:predicted ester cyclase
MVQHKVSNEETARLFVERFYRLWNLRDFEAVIEMIHPNFEDQSSINGAPQVLHGREEFRAACQDSAKALRNTQILILQEIAEGTTICVRLQITAKQFAQFYGRPPAGDRFLMQAIAILELEDQMLRRRYQEATILETIQEKMQ